jgi:hypothetical protein
MNALWRCFSVVCAHGLLLATAAHAAQGGLRLSSHALVAVPQDDHGVFLTWRYLVQDGGLEAAYHVERSARPTRGFKKIATVRQTTTYRDFPGKGTYHYRIVPAEGEFKGKASRVAAVSTSAKGRDWIDLLTAPPSVDYQRRTFADTDGDGEMEFPTYTPDNSSSDGSITFKVQVYELFGDGRPRWSFDTGIRPMDPAVNLVQNFAIRFSCFDVDGDFKAEIIGMAKISGTYKLVVLKDMGHTYEIVATRDLPFALPLDNNEGRILFGGADLGGENHSVVVRLGDWAAGVTTCTSGLSTSMGPA